MPPAAGGAPSPPPPFATFPLPPDPSLGDVVVSWNVGLRGLRPLCDANRGAATAPPDAHGVSRPLGFGSAANLLASLGSRADNIRVVCLQETKLGGGGASEPRAALDARLACPDGWDSVHAVTRDPKKAAGYAGVATYWRRADTAVVAAEVGVTGVNADGERGGVGCYGAMRELFTRARAAELDAEGRCVLVDFGGFVLVNVYVPATTGGSGSEDVEKNARDAFKRDFLLAVETRVDALVDAGRRVVACGDWNVARGTMDAAAARISTGTTGSKLGSSSAAREREFVRACPHRAWLDRQLQRDDGGGDDDDADGGGRRRPRLIDAFRRRYPKTSDAFTCWHVASGAQLTNYGARIDAFYVDEATHARVHRVGIAREHPGSDHAPVFLAFNRGGDGDFELFKAIDAAGDVGPPAIASSVALRRNGGTQRTLKDGFKAIDASGGGGVGGRMPAAMATATPAGGGGAQLSNAGQGGAKRKRPAAGADSNSIRAFFEPKPPPAPPRDRNEPSSARAASVVHGVDAPGPPPAATPTAADDTVNAWKRIHDRMAPPKCRGHGETCKVRSVKKKESANFGRTFFCCPRPAGARGNKDADCGFFQWAAGR